MIGENEHTIGLGPALKKRLQTDKATQKIIESGSTDKIVINPKELRRSTVVTEQVRAENGPSMLIRVLIVDLFNE